MKAQLTIEATAAIIFIIIIFSFISFLVYSKDSEVKQTEEFLAKKQVCLKISNNINAIYNAGDGAVSKIDKTIYDVYINGPAREIEVEEVVCETPISSITNGISNNFTIS